MRLEQLEAGLVIAVVPVDVGIERPRVDDQRDAPTSPASSSSIRSETSAWPPAPARRPGACAFARPLRDAFRWPHG